MNDWAAGVIQLCVRVARAQRRVSDKNPISEGTSIFVSWLALRYVVHRCVETATGGGSVKVVVVGTGYVGLTTGAALAYLGHQVTGVDKDPGKLDLQVVAVQENRSTHLFKPGELKAAGWIYLGVGR